MANACGYYRNKNDDNDDDDGEDRDENGNDNNNDGNDNNNDGNKDDWWFWFKPNPRNREERNSSITTFQNRNRRHSRDSYWGRGDWW